MQYKNDLSTYLKCKKFSVFRFNTFPVGPDFPYRNRILFVIFQNVAETLIKPERNVYRI